MSALLRRRWRWVERLLHQPGRSGRRRRRRRLAYVAAAARGGRRRWWRGFAHLAGRGLASAASPALRSLRGVDRGSSRRRSRCGRRSCGCLLRGCTPLCSRARRCVAGLSRRHDGRGGFGGEQLAGGLLGGGGDPLGRSDWRRRARALDERNAGQAAEAEHPDAEADDPEHGEHRRDDGGAHDQAGAATVAGYEDRLVMRAHAKGRLFRSRHRLGFPYENTALPLEESNLQLLYDCSRTTASLSGGQASFAQSPN